MSLYDYEMSKQIGAKDYPFYSLIMAAMRQADSDNLLTLAEGFPETYVEFHSRYHAQGGLLPGEEVADESAAK